MLDQLASCVLANIMTAQQLARFDERSALTKKQRKKTRGLEVEKASLEKLLREDPILLHSPFDLRLDWFHDDHAWGSRFKTWAGRQSVREIASAMVKRLRRSAQISPATEYITDKLRKTLAAVRSITHLGWGIDMVAANAAVLTEAEADKLPGERWRPVEDSSAAGYRVPIPGTLGALIEKHQAFLTPAGLFEERPLERVPCALALATAGKEADCDWGWAALRVGRLCGKHQMRSAAIVSMEHARALRQAARLRCSCVAPRAGAPA